MCAGSCLCAHVFDIRCVQSLNPLTGLLLPFTLAQMVNSQLSDASRERSAHAFAQLVTLCTLDNASTQCMSMVHWTNARVCALDETGAALPRMLSASAGLPPLSLDGVGLRASVHLRAYQVEGVTWLSMLHRFNLHGILADDMGLGKTLQTLCIVAHAHMAVGRDHVSSCRC